jgi:hypothetical protein
MTNGTRKGVRGQLHVPAALYPQERPGIHCTGGSVGSRAGLDRCGKSRPPRGFDTRTVLPVASRYTDYATRPTGFCKMQVYSSVAEKLFGPQWRAILNEVMQYCGTGLKMVYAFKPKHICPFLCICNTAIQSSVKLKFYSLVQYLSP